MLHLKVLHKEVDAKDPECGWVEQNAQNRVFMKISVPMADVAFEHEVDQNDNEGPLKRANNDLVVAVVTHVDSRHRDVDQDRKNHEAKRNNFRFR